MHRAWGIDSSLKQGIVYLQSHKDTWQASLFLKSVRLKANSHFPSLPSSTIEYPDQNTRIKSSMHLHARQTSYHSVGIEVFVVMGCFGSNHLGGPALVLSVNFPFEIWTPVQTHHTQHALLNEKQSRIITSLLQILSPFIQLETTLVFCEPHLTMNLYCTIVN